MKVGAVGLGVGTLSAYMRPGDAMTHASVLGSTFDGRIVSETSVGGAPAIVPAVRGSAWITGITQVLVDPSDPFLECHWFLPFGALSPTPRS